MIAVCGARHRWPCKYSLPLSYQNRRLSSVLILTLEISIISNHAWFGVTGSGASAPCVSGHLLKRASVAAKGANVALVTTDHLSC